MGRTHGVHAEPTTFGIKLAGFAFEAHRNASGCERAFAQAAVGALSGAVGTYAATSPEFEARVLARLGLAREDVSTQVVARDRHAELLQAIALAGAGLERFATEVRHLQRTEVREVQEPFRAGPEGLARRCRTSATRSRPSRSPASRACCAATPRRRSRTSRCGTSATSPTPRVERVILPDSTILLDYIQHRAIALVKGMMVDEQRMRANLELTHGALFSQRVLLALVERRARAATRPTGSSRSSPSGRGTRRSRCASCSRPTSARGGLDLDAIFDYGHYTRHAEEIVAPARRDRLSAPRRGASRAATPRPPLRSIAPT